MSTHQSIRKLQMLLFYVAGATAPSYSSVSTRSTIALFLLFYFFNFCLFSVLLYSLVICVIQFRAVALVATGTNQIWVNFGFCN